MTDEFYLTHTTSCQKQLQAKKVILRSLSQLLIQALVIRIFSNFWLWLRLYFLILPSSVLSFYIPQK